MKSLKTRIKIWISWHRWAWRIAKKIPWQKKQVKWLIIQEYGLLRTFGIYLGLINLKLSDIAFLEKISRKKLIKICGA